MTERSQNRRDFDEWDAVFEDSDPTRVLDPRAVQGSESPAPPIDQVANQPDAGVSATRYQRTPQPQSPAEDEEEMAARQAYSWESPQQTLPAEPLEPAQASARSASPRAAAALHRVQFIPAFCGALVTYALASGGLALARTVMGLFGQRAYSGLTETVLAATTPASQAQALPWLITVAVILALAFGTGGYTASRMTALAPSKQALGVLAVSALGLLLTTLLTWATAQMETPLAPAYALQPLLTPDFMIGALTALAAGLLGLLAALLGAGLGIRYHRALTTSDTQIH